MRIFDKSREEKLEEMGRNLERAFEDLTTIATFENSLIDIVYENVPADETKKRVFGKETANKVLRLEVYYKETDEILAAKKDKLSQVEKALLAELESIKNEKEKL